MAKSKKQSWAKKRIEQWLARNIPPTDSITLNRRNIFILPTANGLLFLLAAGVIFLAAINYEISLAFGLAFLMVSIFVVTMLYSFNNLNRLKITSLPTSAVFSGEDAGFEVLLSRSRTRTHENLELNFPDSTLSLVDLARHDQEKVAVFARTQQRGQFRAPRLRISTCFPLGLFRAWSVVDMNLHCLVYPKPITVPVKQLLNMGASADESKRFRDGSEDFYGLRTYVVGDSMRQVSWKNYARGQGMMVKHFVEYIDEKVWLDWDMFYGFDIEARMSRLCHCTIRLSAAGATFGLKLPGVEIAPAKGGQHKLRVLETLALYKASEFNSMSSG